MPDVITKFVEVCGGDWWWKCCCLFVFLLTERFVEVKNSKHCCSYDRVFVGHECWLLLLVPPSWFIVTGGTSMREGERGNASPFPTVSSKITCANVPTWSMCDCLPPGLCRIRLRSKIKKKERKKRKLHRGALVAKRERLMCDESIGPIAKNMISNMFWVQDQDD